MLDVRTTRDLELEQMCYPDGDDFWNSYHFMFEDFLPESEKDKDPGQGETELCRFFSRGTCRNGDNCQYRHSRSSVDKKAVVCKHWLRGLCKKGDFCDFLHEYRMDLMPECTFFSRYGKCNNSDCNFRHISPDEKLRECPWYAKGWCRHGPRCRHKHIKKLACANYLAGFCPDGPDCKFGHPKFETIPTNLSSLEHSSSTGDHKPSLDHHKVNPSNHHMISPSNPNHPKNNFLELKKGLGGAGLGGAGRGMGPPICHKCGQTGHKSTVCPNPNSMNNNPSLQPTPANPAIGHPSPGAFTIGVPPAPGSVPLHGNNTWRNTTRPAGPRPLETVTCYKCGQMGHYANKCPNPALNPNNPMKQQQNRMNNPGNPMNPNQGMKMNYQNQAGMTGQGGGYGGMGGYGMGGMMQQGQSGMGGGMMGGGGYGGMPTGGMGQQPGGMPGQSGMGQQPGGMMGGGGMNSMAGGMWGQQPGMMGGVGSGYMGGLGGGMSNTDYNPMEPT